MIVEGLLLSTLTLLLGLWLGHRLTVAQHKYRIKHLESAFYTEWQLLFNQFKSTLETLSEEYRYPVVEKTIGYSPIDLEYLDSIAVELIAQSEVIQPDHRKFISNFKAVIIGLEREFRERDQAVDSSFDGDVFHIPKKPNGVLMSYLVELLYQLDRVVSMKRKYSFDHPDYVSIVDSPVIENLGLSRTLLLDAYKYTGNTNN